MADLQISGIDSTQYPAARFTQTPVSPAQPPAQTPVQPPSSHGATLNLHDPAVLQAAHGVMKEEQQKEKVAQHFGIPYTSPFRVSGFGAPPPPSTIAPTQPTFIQKAVEAAAPFIRDVFGGVGDFVHNLPPLSTDAAINAVSPLPEGARFVRALAPNLPTSLEAGPALDTAQKYLEQKNYPAAKPILDFLWAVQNKNPVTGAPMPPTTYQPVTSTHPENVSGHGATLSSLSQKRPAPSIQNLPADPSGIHGFIRGSVPFMLASAFAGEAGITDLFDSAAAKLAGRGVEKMSDTMNLAQLSKAGGVLTNVARTAGSGIGQSLTFSASHSKSPQEFAQNSVQDFVGMFPFLLAGGAAHVLLSKGGQAVGALVSNAAKEGVDLKPVQVMDYLNGNKDPQMEQLFGSLTGENRLALLKAHADNQTHIGERRLIGLKGPEEEPVFKTGKENTYVKDEPLNIRMGKNDKSTAQNIREEFTGAKNSQIVRGNNLRDSIKRDVPSLVERQGMFWFKAAKGDASVLQAALKDPKFDAYKTQLEAALKLSPAAQKALTKVGTYYDEAGQVSKDIGTIKDITENYQNRIYQPEPPKEFVGNEAKRGLAQSTSHAKARVYDTELDAVRGGKKFATTDIADALSVHNEEMARVNTSRKLADSLSESGLGAWHQRENMPEGWKQVGTLEKNVPIKDAEGKPIIGENGNQIVSRSIFTAPQGIVKGLRAIADPNFAKKIDAIRGIQKYQGIVKTVDLSYSFFHHFSMAMQTLYEGNYRALGQMATMNKILEKPEFAEMESDFAKHTGITSQVESNQDIIRNLLEPDDKSLLGKATRLPGVKLFLGGAQKSSNFLFGKMQRMLKVQDYSRLSADWAADHPTATNEQVDAAKIGFAKHVNAVYGGLNWEAMGIDQSTLSLLRTILLAPDWTISNIELGKNAFKTGAAGSAARKHYVGAIATGLILTEGMSTMLTGHTTDKNPVGHKFEVEISPGVYVSFFRGGIGDLLKLGSKITDQGLLKGVASFTQGKLAPIARTTVGVLSGTQYGSKPITTAKRGWFGKSADYATFIGNNAGPVPFSVPNLVKYATDKKSTPQGALGLGTGLAIYAPPKRFH